MGNEEEWSREMWSMEEGRKWKVEGGNETLAVEHRK
jgi:hypothetical protein